MRLRRRLLLTMVVVLVVALAVVDVVTYTELRSALFGRLDEQLEVAQHQVFRYANYEAGRGRQITSDRLDQLVSPDVYVIISNRRGTVVAYSASGSQTDPDPAPLFPRGERVLTAPVQETFGRHQGAFRPSGVTFTVGAHGDPTARYQASALAVPQGVALLAISLNSTIATLDSLERIEVIVSLVVVALLAVIVLWTIRRGLRPLEDMARTAGAIAAGDLTQRVPDAGDDSEVGRLGLALNTMLARIEVAFNERVHAETRLRQFVADASHELRTPLTSIQGYTELLRKGAFADDEARRRALQRVENEAVRMSAMVDDLLLLARLDEGRSLDHIPVDLSRVAAEAVEDARAVDSTRDIQLEAPRPVVVMGDRYGLRQVAHNLVRNALAHTPVHAPVRVVVAADGDRGVLRVLDRGPGLDPVTQTKVFDRFFRADAARTGSGSGLGLTIVKAIAEALDGQALVRSAPGRGAEFIVTLPLAPAGTAPPPPRSTAPRSPQVVDRRRVPRRPQAAGPSGPGAGAAPQEPGVAPQEPGVAATASPANHSPAPG